MQAAESISSHSDRRNQCPFARLPQLHKWGAALGVCLVFKYICWVVVVVVVALLTGFKLFLIVHHLEMLVCKVINNNEQQQQLYYKLNYAQ